MVQAALSRRGAVTHVPTPTLLLWRYARLRAVTETRLSGVSDGRGPLTSLG